MNESHHISKNIKIFAIIVTYNGAKWIEKCFGSLINSNIPLNILVIDNGSSDNTPNIVRKKYPMVEIIQTGENLGFTKANNIGIKFALKQRADYVFLLNQDAWIEKNTIEELMDTFQQIPQTGIVSPIHLNGNKTNLDKGFLNYIAPHNTPNFVSDLYFHRLENFHETQFVNAASWLISRACIEKVGGFDSLLFLHYGEDGNYCQRVMYHGYKVIVNTNCFICHDREDRNPVENQLWENKKKLVATKVFLGNINENFSVIYIILYTIRRTFFALLFSKTKNALSKITEIFVFYDIVKSRKLNKRGGLVWL